MATSPFRSRLESAADRLESLASRSAPSIAVTIRIEVTAIREASARLEGEACEFCSGRGYFSGSAKCTSCDGKGDL